MRLRWRPSRGDWRALLRSSPLFVLIAVAAAVSYRYHQLLLSQRDLVEHTYRVITALESTFVRIVDAETGQRGYVITGDAAYLVPYARAVKEIPTSLADLRRLTADSPSQLRREELLKGRLEAKLGELEETIVARRDLGLPAAQLLGERDRGRVEMDAVRVILGEMRQAESALLARRDAEARATERRLLATTPGCVLVSLLARMGIALVRHRARARAGTAPTGSRSTRLTTEDGE